ncbi:MAG: PQQ-binding-like beta-propeller repeat protein [Oceanipulchritudo sp.]
MSTRPLYSEFPIALLTLPIFCVASGLTGAPGDLAPGWPVATDGVVFGSPAIGPQGEVVVGSQDRSLYSFNPDGSLRWVFGAGDWIDSSPTIAADGTVYFGCWDNFLYALDGETGSLKWKFETGSLVINSPAIGPDGTVYFGSYDGLLYALPPDGPGPDNEPLWSAQPSFMMAGEPVVDFGAVTASPVLNPGGDTLYFGTENGNLYAVDAASGVQQWYFRVPTITGTDEISAAPAVAEDGTIVFSSQNGTLYALSANGTLQWSFPTTESIKSSPVIDASGTVYFAAQDGYLYAIDSIGFQLWETFVGDVFYCTPALDSSGNIIIGAYAGSQVIGAASVFMALDSTGAVLWEHLIEGYNDSSPNIAPDGSIYVGAHDGFLYKLEGSAPLMKAGWPRQQANRRNTGFLQDLTTMELVDYFPAIQSLLDGWAEVPWFGSGWVRAYQLPWIEHADHGFLYVQEPATDSVHCFDSKLRQWFHATGTAQDYYYLFSDQTWVYHLEGSQPATDRWFFDFSQSLWVQYPR